MAPRPVDEGRALAVGCAQAHEDDATALQCLNEGCLAAHSDDIEAYRGCVDAGYAEMRRQEFLAEGRPRIGVTPEIVGMGTVRVFSDPTGNHRPVVDIASLRQVSAEESSVQPNSGEARVVGASAIAVPMTIEMLLAKPLAGAAGLDVLLADAAVAAHTFLFGSGAGAALASELFLNPQATRRVQEVGIIPDQRDEAVYMVATGNGRPRSERAPAKACGAEVGTRPPSPGRRPPEKKEGLLTRFMNWVRGRESSAPETPEAPPPSPSVRPQPPPEPKPRDDHGMPTMVLDAAGARGRKPENGLKTMVLEVPSRSRARQERPVEPPPLIPPPVALDVRGPFAPKTPTAAEGAGYAPARAPRPLSELLSEGELAALRGAPKASAPARGGAAPPATRQKTTPPRDRAPLQQLLPTGEYLRLQKAER